MKFGLRTIVRSSDSGQLSGPKFFPGPTESSDNCPKSELSSPVRSEVFSRAARKFGQLSEVRTSQSEVRTFQSEVRTFQSEVRTSQPSPKFVYEPHPSPKGLKTKGNQQSGPVRSSFRCESPDNCPKSELVRTSPVRSGPKFFLGRPKVRTIVRSPNFPVRSGPKFSAREHEKFGLVRSCPKSELVLSPKFQS